MILLGVGQARLMTESKWKWDTAKIFSGTANETPSTSTGVFVFVAMVEGVGIPAGWTLLCVYGMGRCCAKFGWSLETWLRMYGYVRNAIFNQILYMILPKIPVVSLLPHLA